MARHIQSTDELDILEALIESNHQRAKNGEQIGREADKLEWIEAQRAKLKQQEHGQTAPGRKKETLEEPIPQVKKQKRAPQARDAVGKKVGTSGRTAERAAFAVQVMDTLAANGKPVESHQIKQQLKRNITKAHTLAKTLEPLTKPPAEPLLFSVPTRQKYITLEAWDTMSETERTIRPFYRCQRLFRRCAEITTRGPAHTHKGSH